MTIEEKLEHFREASLDAASREAYEELNSWKQKLDGQFADHCAKGKARAEQQIRVAARESRQTSNKELAGEQMACKRELSRCEQELTERLYAETREVLEKVKQTPEYADRLKKQAEAALAFAQDEEMVILLDPSDAAFLTELEKTVEGHPVRVLLSEEPFGGGTRAEIPSMNIRIDSSFQQKFDDIRGEFRLLHVL